MSSIIIYKYLHNQLLDQRDITKRFLQFDNCSPQIHHVIFNQFRILWNIIIC